MTMLSRIRGVAFMLVLAAVISGNRSAIAGEYTCQGFGYCADCETPPGFCYIPTGGGECDQYPMCQHYKFCGGTVGGAGVLCICGPC
jgi:hypothetical protein